MKATRNLISRLLVLPLALGLAACDNPVDHEDEHLDGLVIVDAQGTEVVVHTVGGGTSGELVVGLTGTSTFTVHGLAEDGDRITIDGDELELTLDDITPDWTMTVQGSNQLVIGAPSAGSTTVRVVLFHDGHEELSATVDVRAE